MMNHTESQLKVSECPPGGHERPRAEDPKTYKMRQMADILIAARRLVIIGTQWRRNLGPDDA